MNVIQAAHSTKSPEQTNACKKKQEINFHTKILFTTSLNHRLLHLIKLFYINHVVANRKKSKVLPKQLITLFK